MTELSAWEQIRATLGAMGVLFGPPMARFTEATGLDGSTMVLVIVMMASEPEALRLDDLHKLSPYTAPVYFESRLVAAVAAGVAEEGPPRSYRLTEAGRAQIDAANTDSDPPVPELLAGADSRRLVELLGALVESTMAAPPPPESWFSTRMHRLIPATTDPPLPYVMRSIVCLDGYRMDSHHGAWAPTGLSGLASESLTLLWRGQADSLAGIVEAMAVRAHTQQAHANAIDDLRTRGLVAGPDEAVAITTTGRAVRDDVEAATDRYFFAPWSVFKAGEPDELAGLLAKLQAGLAGLTTP